MTILLMIACGDAPPVAQSSLAPAAGSITMAPVPEFDALLAGIEFGEVAPDEVRVHFGDEESVDTDEEGSAEEAQAGLVESAFDAIASVGSRFKVAPEQPIARILDPGASPSEAPIPQLSDVQKAVEAPEGPPAVDPGLSIEQVVRRYSSQTQYCHHAARERWSEVAGRIEIAWTVVEGQVQDVEIIDDTTGDSAMASCVARKVKYWRFPADTNAEVSHPFVFDQADFQ